jgi:sec-independent protein translocase protein TatA
MFTGLASPTHLLLLLVVILLLFGAKRLPEMGRGLAQGIQEFKEGLDSKADPEEAVEQRRLNAIEKEIPPQQATREKRAEEVASEEPVGSPKDPITVSNGTSDDTGVVDDEASTPTSKDDVGERRPWWRRLLK